MAAGSSLFDATDRELDLKADPFAGLGGRFSRSGETQGCGRDNHPRADTMDWKAARRSRPAFAAEAHKFVCRRRCVVGNVDDTVIQRAAQRKHDSRCNVPVVNCVDLLGGMPTANVLRKGFQVAVTIALHERKSQNCPVQAAYAQIWRVRPLRAQTSR